MSSFSLRGPHLVDAPPQRGALAAFWSRYPTSRTQPTAGCDVEELRGSPPPANAKSETGSEFYVAPMWQLLRLLLEQPAEAEGDCHFSDEAPAVLMPETASRLTGGEASAGRCRRRTRRRRRLRTINVWSRGLRDLRPRRRRQRRVPSIRRNVERGTKGGARGRPGLPSGASLQHDSEKVPSRRRPRGAHSRFPGHALTPTGVMAIRCKQFHLPDL